MLINFFCTNRHIELNLTLNSMLINICSDKRGDTLQRKGWNSVGKKIVVPIKHEYVHLAHHIYMCRFRFMVLGSYWTKRVINSVQ